MPHSTKPRSAPQCIGEFSLAKRIEETRAGKMPKFNESKHLNHGPFYDRFLDWYEIYSEGKSFAEAPFKLDDEDGSVVAQLEIIEKMCAPFFNPITQESHDWPKFGLLFYKTSDGSL